MSNIVQVHVGVENGCSQENGEYTLHISSFLEPLDINRCGGLDDVDLIKEACDEYLQDPENYQLKEGHGTLRLEESGEWEDVFWHKYYVVIHSEFHEI